MGNTYENHSICSACGGHCCLNMPGSCSPDDVMRYGDNDDLAIALVTVLSSGKFALDYWDGDPRDLDWEDDNYMSSVRYVRPRHKGSNEMFDRSWGKKPCVFLETGVGCTLKAENRPQNCRELEPGKDECIKHDGSNHGIALLWIPWQKILVDTAMRVEREIR